MRLTEIEDIKAQTGIDVIQKMEGVLVNELSQAISKEIVAKLFDMGDLNRASAPILTGTTTVFDFDVDNYLMTNAPGGETSQSLQRKLITKIKKASGYILQEGRVGPATFIVTNFSLASALMEGSSYTLSPSTGGGTSTQLYPMGKVEGMTVYVDPYMSFYDNRILVGRKNDADKPGVVFIPYLMAQSVTIISEGTFANIMVLRSRHAVGELGFFPQE